MQTLIYTPFKVGSCSLYSYLRNNNITTGKWLKSQEIIDPDKLIIIKLHSDTYKIKEIINQHMPQFSPNIIFTIIRDPREIYMSAYFQDITNPGYPYYFDCADNVVSCDVNDLVNHFLSFSWDEYEHVNLYTCIKTLEEYTGIDIFGQSFDKTNKYKIYQNDKFKLCILNIELLNNKEIIKQICNELGYPPEIIDGILLACGSNISSDKWYAEKYKEFKKAMPPRNLYGHESIIAEQFL